MADRSQAMAFGTVFRVLAKHLARDIALDVWQSDEFQTGDFTNDQMNADAELVALGLARRGIHPACPNDGECVLYADRKGWVSEFSPVLGVTIRTRPVLL